MFEGDFERSMLSGSQSGSANSKDRMGFAQGDLIRIVKELDGHFQSGQRASARVDCVGGKRGYFLMNEILRAAQSNVFDPDIRGVTSFRGANRR